MKGNRNSYLLSRVKEANPAPTRRTSISSTPIVPAIGSKDAGLALMGPSPPEDMIAMSVYVELTEKKTRCHSFLTVQMYPAIRSNEEVSWHEGRCGPKEWFKMQRGSVRAEKAQSIEILEWNLSQIRYIMQANRSSRTRRSIVHLLQ